MVLLIGSLGTNPQWNLDRNSYIYIQENAFENIVCEIMAAILSRGRCVNCIKHIMLHIPWLFMTTKPVFMHYRSPAWRFRWSSRFSAQVKTESYHDANFVVAGGTRGCRYDRWKCCQWPTTSVSLQHQRLYRVLMFSLRVKHTLRPRQNGRRFADDIFKLIFL